MSSSRSRSRRPRVAVDFSRRLTGATGRRYSPIVKTYAKTWPHEYNFQEKVDPYPAMEKTMSRTFRVGLVAAT